MITEKQIEQIKQYKKPCIFVHSTMVNCVKPLNIPVKTSEWIDKNTFVICDLSKMIF